jgi:hypothetical protein
MFKKHCIILFKGYTGNFNVYWKYNYQNNHVQFSKDIYITMKISFYLKKKNKKNDKETK